MAHEINRVGVVGLGTMGAGIVEVFARAGLDVVAVEVDAGPLERGRATLTASVGRAVARGRLAAADRDALLARVDLTTDTAALGPVDLVVEAVPERMELKRAVFAELERVCRRDAVLATNTSSLAVTEIAAGTDRADRVVGMHFFNPAPVMRLVEVVRTVLTDPDAVAAVSSLCTRIGKVGVSVGDRAGFIANALLFGYLNQAVGMVGSGRVAPTELDAAMTLGAGLPMGPLALLDLIGLDVAYEILTTMYRRGGRGVRHAPDPLLAEMVAAGLLGRKSGRGFHRYGPDGPPAETAAESGVDTPAMVGVVAGGGPLTGLAAALADAGDRVTTVESGRLDDLGPADVVLCDGGPEVFAALDAVCRPGAVLASVSDRPVVGNAAATSRPADVVGLHPVGERLVEVVHTVRTAPAAVATARALGRRAGRTPVGCPDRAGFVVGALVVPYLNDAVRMVEASYATPDDIDAAMTLGCGYPEGPLTRLEQMGPAVALDLMRRIWAETREPGLAPAPLLEQLVTAGRGPR
jgi:3-hydroxybutyryl-CoA dehydrogenase